MVKGFAQNGPVAESTYIPGVENVLSNIVPLPVAMTVPEVSVNVQLADNVVSDSLKVSALYWHIVALPVMLIAGTTLIVLKTLAPHNFILF
jgi:hypothetical protein